MKTLVDKVLQRLADEGLEPHIHADCKTGSTYINFECQTLNTLRISDHKGKARYGCKWNIRTDIPKGYIHRDHGRIQFFYTAYDVGRMIRDMKRFKKREEDKGD